MERPRIEVRCLAYPDHIEACYRVRRRVFIEEQAVTEAEEIDGRDPECLHFLAEVDGEAVGAARLRDGGQGVGKAERVAVLAPHRRRGVGEALMATLESAAKTQGFHEVLLGAQLTALEFYRRLGYQVEGEQYLDARIPHRWMRKALSPLTARMTLEKKKLS